MFMQGRNNLDVANVIIDWIDGHVAGASEQDDE
jgi:hypothetical protein